MSNTIINPSKEDKAKIQEEINKINGGHGKVRFDNFQEIQIEGTFTIKELKATTDVIETAEAFLALEQGPIKFENRETPCIECGGTKEPIIRQCEICGGAIRACCPDHEKKC